MRATLTISGCDITNNGQCSIVTFSDILINFSNPVSSFAEGHFEQVLPTVYRYSYRGMSAWMLAHALFKIEYQIRSRLGKIPVECALKLNDLDIEKATRGTHKDSSKDIARAILTALAPVITAEGIKTRYSFTASEVTNVKIDDCGNMFVLLSNRA